MTKEVVLERLVAALEENSSRKARARRIAEILRDAGPFRWVGIYDVDAQAGLVVNLAWSGPSAPAHPTFPVTKGITSRAIAGKKTINVGNVAADPDYLTALGGTRSEVIVPVLDANEKRVLGTIDVESERADAFDLAAQAFLEECSRALGRLFSESSE